MQYSIFVYDSGHTDLPTLIWRAGLNHRPMSPVYVFIGVRSDESVLRTDYTLVTSIKNLIINPYANSHVRSIQFTDRIHAHHYAEIGRIDFLDRYKNAHVSYTTIAVFRKRNGWFPIKTLNPTRTNYLVVPVTNVLYVCQQAGMLRIYSRLKTQHDRN